ncbi:Tn7 transposase TnsA N-terminal domain-containing protein [Paenibacillus paridis]|uniref:Tn7 transposase TnsA N-terminal domain-containing protein n=1 Tax=Paenibacillus paridis TaxID=2583376 RepID=UPI003082DC90
MTTDFLVTHKDKHYARTLNPFSELENERTIAKFDIECVYWEERHGAQDGRPLAIRRSGQDLDLSEGSSRTVRGSGNRDRKGQGQSRFMPFLLARIS